MELRENQVVGVVNSREDKVEPAVITMFYKSNLNIRVSTGSSDFPVERNRIQFVLPGFEALLRRNDY